MVLDGELLVQIRQSLIQLTNRLTNIQAGREAVGAHVVQLMTLREFTEST